MQQVQGKFHLSMVAKSSWISVDDFIEMDYFKDYPIKEFKKTKIANLGMAFDIETSKVGDYSFMYIWQVAIDEVTVIGRTWVGFERLLDYINRSNKSKSKILCLVHNLPFEFQFMKNYVEWSSNWQGKKDIFAMDERHVVYARNKTIEFRDTLALTNRKLAKLAVDYKLEINKLENDLDYNLVRLPSTKMTELEIAYCINDVQILQRFFHRYLKKEFLEKGYKIPLTSTGIVRSELKRLFKKLPASERNDWTKKVIKSFPNSQTEYEEVMRWLYRGGYVHANAVHVERKFEYRDDLSSFDFKSSYPAVLLHEKFPMKFVKRKPEYFDIIKNDRKWLKENAFYGSFTFKNIHLKDGNFHSIESKNKIFSHKNAKFDNGRLVMADEITVCLTDYDWLIYNDFMAWEEVECLAIKISSKEELPQFLKQLIITYYELKETIDKETLEYILTKAKLNAIYGMCCTALYTEDYSFENGVLKSHSSSKTYEDLVSKQILTPWIGIWCTAAARYNLLHTISKIGVDVIYGDTDSNKMMNTSAHVHVIDEYNERIARMNKKLPTKLTKIGMFDYEGRLANIKTYGSKRYISTQYNVKSKCLKTKPTVAGLPKMAISEVCKKKKINPYEFFEKGMDISAEDMGDSKKMRCHYEDNEFELTVTDYEGYTDTIRAKSCATLIEVGFTMKVQPEYIGYYTEAKKKAERAIGVRI